MTKRSLLLTFLLAWQSAVFAVGIITQISLANASACNGGSTTCASDDFFTAEITVVFDEKPATGTLALSGADLLGAAPSVNVSAVSGTSHTFSGVQLRSDGAAVSLTATFSAGESLENTNLATAPAACSSLPTSITVGGFSVCPDENGVYTMTGTENGAPIWESATDKLYWTGSAWHLVYKPEGWVLSSNTAGSAAQLPCSGWTDGIGCGAATFEGCASFPANVVSGISLANQSACQAGASCAPDFFTSNISVQFAYAPASGNLVLSRNGQVLATKPASELACATSWTFSNVSMQADGQPILLTAAFSNGSTFTSTSLGNAPAFCEGGKVLSMAVANISGCVGQNTTCASDDAFTADVTLTFSTPPATGFLTLSGADILGAAPTVAVGDISGNSHTFTGVSLRSDGSAIDLTGSFSDGCSMTENALGTAPAACSSIPPNVVASGLDYCYIYPENLTLAGFQNGAPFWEGATERLHWTGSAWQLDLPWLLPAYSHAGSPSHLPCSGWVDQAFCGVPTFSFCGNLPTPSISGISLADQSACQSGAPCSPDFFTSNITVQFAYAPATGNLALSRNGVVLATKPASELACATSWTFSNVEIEADGKPFALTASFASGATFAAQNLGNTPQPCAPNKVHSIVLSNVSNCLGQNTTCSTDDIFTADVVLNFTAAPATGSLELSGASIVGAAPSVAVGDISGNSHTFAGVVFRADGAAIELTAAFSDGCSTTDNSLGTAPASCSPVPSSITVSGFNPGCAGENGVYLLTGTQNGAPVWEHATSKIYWQGVWYLLHKPSGNVLAYNNTGSATSLPCSGWAGDIGCGLPTILSGCGLSFTASISSISLANTSACQNGTACTPDFFTSNVTVQFAYSAATGDLTLSRNGQVLATKTASELACVSSWTFSNVEMLADGQPILLTAAFSNGATFTSTSLGNAPSTCSAGRIFSLALSNVSSCNSQLTHCSTDDFFTADLTLTFSSAPATGSLSLSGTDILGTPPTVAVGDISGNSHTFPGVKLRADGAAIGLTGSFSDGCSLTNNALGTAPTGCSSVPTSLTVGGIPNCFLEIGNYNLKNQVNGAPAWSSSRDSIYWTGSQWNFLLKPGNVLLLHNTTGSAGNFPCSNWIQDVACGVPTFSFCGDLLLPSISGITLANQSDCSISSPCGASYFLVDVSVQFGFAPATGDLVLSRNGVVLGTKPASELACSNSWIFTAQEFEADGSPFNLTASFTNGVSFTAQNLGNVPTTCVPDKVMSIVLSNVSDADLHGTSCTSDDSFTADATLDFSSVPATGTLVLSGADLINGSISVDVADIVGNSHTFSGISLRADGEVIELTGTFSEGCSTTRNAGIAPAISPIPAAITVEGFPICPAETGVYTLSNFANGAPTWHSATDSLFWTGSYWALVYKPTGALLSTNASGAADNLPCSGWTNSLGCGSPIISAGCGNYAMTTVSSISLANTSACQVNANCETDIFTTDVNVQFAFAPATGNLTLSRKDIVLATKPASELACATNWTFSNLQIEADGDPILLTASFANTASLTATNLGNAPQPCTPNRPKSIVVSNISGCTGLGTNCTTDDYYTANVTMTFTSVPATGSLVLSGADVVGASPTVAVSQISGNTYTFVGVSLRADGAAIELTANFTDGCSLTKNSLGTAPNSCSALPAQIYIGLSLCLGGNYNLNGFANGAPRWTHHADPNTHFMFFDGVWGVYSFLSNGAVSGTTFNFGGNTHNIPCTGWTTGGCTGGVTPSIGICGELLSVRVNNILFNQTGCSRNGTCADASDDKIIGNVTAHFQYPPTVGKMYLRRGLQILDSVEVSELGCLTSWTFSNVEITADGQPLSFTVEFPNYTYLVKSFGNTPSNIFCTDDTPTSIILTNVSACHGNLTRCGSDDFFTADVVVLHGGKPASGTLSISGADILEAVAPVSVSQISGNFYTFSNVKFRADGAAVGLSASFSAGCDFENPNLATAPASCSSQPAAQISSIAGANFSACQNFGTCPAGDDKFTLDATVNFNYAPATGNLTLLHGTTILATKSAADLACSNSWTFVGVQIPANGQAVNLTAKFSNDIAKTSSVGTAPAACSEVGITSISIVSMSDCNDAGTPTIIGDDFFNAIVQVNYADKPATGHMVLTSPSLAYPYSIPVNYMAGGTLYISGLQLRSDGQAISMTAAFSDGCSFTSTNIGTAPGYCSCDLASSFQIIEPTCFGNSNGTVFTTTTGGKSPYTYSWSNSKTTKNQNLLAAGNYVLTTSDSDGCTVVGTAAVGQPAAIVASIAATQTTATISASGGTPAFLYNRTGATTFQSNPVFAGLTPGSTYIFKVQDSKGCQKSIIKKLPTTGPMAAGASDRDEGFVNFSKVDKTENTLDFVLFPNPTEDFLNIQFLNEERLLGQVEIFNSFGQQVLSQNLVVEPDESSSLHIEHLPEGGYFLIFKKENGAFSSQPFFKM